MNMFEQKIAAQLQKGLDDVNNPSWEKQLDAINHSSKAVPVIGHGLKRQFIFITACVCICAAGALFAIYHFTGINSDINLDQTENSLPASTNTGYHPASLNVGSLPADHPNTNPTLAQSEEELLKLQRQDYAINQNELLMQAGTPGDFAGTALDENSNLIIYITGSPEDFIREYDNVLDFSVITVTQVQFTMDQLESVQGIFRTMMENGEWSRLGIIGCGIDEYANQVEVIVLQADKDHKAEIEKIAQIPGIMEITLQNEEYEPK